MFILRILYNLLIIIIIPFAVPLGFLFALKKKEDADYFQRFGFITFPEPPAKTVWFHCASVGEVRSLKQLINAFRRRYPDAEFIISTTTATGKAIAEKELKPYFAFLLPIENPIAIPYILYCMNVRATVIIDTELWPNFITSTSKHAPLFLVNARISDRSLGGYMRIRRIISPLLHKFEHIFTKSDEDTARFAAIKGDSANISTLGNIKFSEFEGEPDLSVIKPITDKPFIVAASTHKGEETAVINAFLASGFDGRLVIAPRHLHRTEECLSLLKSAGLNPCALTGFDPCCSAVVADVFGQLEALYRTADRIFIGGSITNIGGHNIFEALRFGRHVAVGPNMQNFREIYELAAEYRLVTTAANEHELAEFFSSPEPEGNFEGFRAEVQASADERLGRFLEAMKVALID
ncbi:3-deoxy-D-manno-octulosonic acid transferase [Geovibrio thiophilus]|uniref:3-deoxy-D-manno-octulosonic acid transferase n=1 Tax=Geovibrio thiophilus TaxID=139438 RepID=A0A410K1M7_9BACT|nr:glycosyltransferase N-terminal domain-containing protein [Geovibrio thiophilus]QAR34205.1 3-deoxy-D-manno-octulosonic acid transferase [Geovibrio thiophilus]